MTIEKLLNKGLELLGQSKAEKTIGFLWITLGYILYKNPQNNLFCAQIVSLEDWLQRKMPGQTLLLLFFLFLMVVVLEVQKHKKVNPNKYTHETDPGWFVDKKGTRICSKCIYPPKNIVVPLSVYKGTRDWHCRVCGDKYIPKDGGDSIILDSKADDVFA